MRIYSLEHDEEDSLVFITRWFENNHVHLNSVKLYRGDPLPNPNRVNLLIIMGGGMSIHEEEKYPWLILEKTFIRKVIELGTPVLEICLGGQLISSLLGGTVTQSVIPEYGWHSLKLVPGALTEVSSFGIFSKTELFPDEIAVFQWHKDIFSIPPWAIHLYTSDICKNQAYIFDSRVIGLQFHLEMAISAIRDVLIQSKDFFRDEFHFKKSPLSHGIYHKR